MTVMQALQNETDSIKTIYTDKFQTEINKAQTLYSDLRTKLNSLTLQSPTAICSLKKGITPLDLLTQPSNPSNPDSQINHLAHQIKTAKQTLTKKVNLFHYFLKLLQNATHKKNAYDTLTSQKLYEKDFNSHKTKILLGFNADLLISAQNPSKKLLPPNIDSQKCSLGGFEESLGRFDSKLAKFGISNR
jgi:hypothetical protein